LSSSRGYIYRLRWRRPRQNELVAFPQGIPPFDPFPEATIVSHGDCPMKIIFKYLESKEVIGSLPSYFTSSGGELFHKAVALAKLVIWNNKCNISNPSVVQQVLQILRQTYQVNDIILNNIGNALMNYLTRKRADIDAQYGHEVFFECWIVNPYTEMRLTGGTYPVVCRVDEIDFDQKLIVERTIVDNPPLYKQVQALIYHRALTSLLTRHPRMLSSQLRRMLRGNWRVVIETPLNDVPINPASMQLECIVWNGLRYIQEIIHPSGRGWGLFFINRSCNPPVWNRNCEYFGLCIASLRRFQYPVARTYLRPRVLNILRLLLYDLVWSWDRYLYALSMHDPHQLLQMGYREPYGVGTIRGSSQPNRLIIEVDQAFRGLIGRIKDAGIVYLIPEPYRFVLGPRIPCNVISTSNKTLEVKVSSPLSISLPHHQVLLTISQRAFVTQTPPISKIVLEKRRRAISKLRLAGTSDLLEYQRRGALRLIDALTGRAPLSSQPIQAPSVWKSSFMNKIRHMLQLISHIR